MNKTKRKIDLRRLIIPLNSKFWHSWYDKIIVATRHLPRILFVKHSHAVDIIAVVLVLLLAGYLVLTLLFYAPVSTEAAMFKQQPLTTELLTRLNLWLQDREAERARPLNLSGDRLFYRTTTAE